jgi:monoamine oxidase
MAELETREADVVVVGAGLAGLAAARAVAAAGGSVVVLEARDRVGGRVLNHDIGDGKVVEVGGQWIGPTQDRLAELARELGVETFPTHAKGHNLLEYGGSVRRYTGTIPRINPAVLVDVQQAQTRLNRLARRVPLGAPWEARGAAKLDAQTAATWMQRNMATKSGRMLLELGVEAVWAAQPEDMSLLHVLFYIHSAGSLEMLFDTEGGAQQDRFVGGSQLLPLRMAAELGTEHVVLGAPVRRIEHGADEGVTVHADGAVARGRRAILAIAPTLAGRIAYDPALPPLRDQLTQHMPQGSLMKFEAVYPSPFWRDKGLTGQVVSELGPVKVTFDVTPEGGTPGVMMGFIGGHEARVWEQRSAANRRAAVLDQFAHFFGDEARSPRETVEFNWSTEVWSRGCPVAVLAPGTLVDFGATLRKPVGRIHWAGTETSTYWNGYMDGAVRSGKRASGEVLRAL